MLSFPVKKSIDLAVFGILMQRYTSIHILIPGFKCENTSEVDQGRDRFPRIIQAKTNSGFYFINIFKIFS